MNKSSQKTQRGLASIEFLLVAPILIMLLCAIAEFGWALHQYNSVTRASRDGARYAASNSLEGSVGLVILTGDTAEKTKNIVVYGNPMGTGPKLLPDLTVADVTVTVVDSTHVQVTTAYQYRPIFGQIPLFGPQGSFSLDLQMAGTVKMRAI